MSDGSSKNSPLSPEKLRLKSWGLPKLIVEKYASKGIESMFPWQMECLSCDGVLSGRNLVYSAPTSAGKTMVAEILTIQTVLERKKKVIIILPFISVVREKMLYFQSLLGGSGVRVEGWMGSHAPPGGLRAVHVAVCTIEKANSLINRLLEDHGLDSVGCVVVDEIHLLGDPHRGYILELLLTKLKYMCMKDKTLSIQVVGMSATLPNLPQLAEWLDAALYTTDFRPVPLYEYLKVDSVVYDASTLQPKYTVQPLVKFKSDSGDVIHLCLESLLAGHSVLVFCPSRSFCETSAQQIAAEFRRIGYEKGNVGMAVRDQLNGNALSNILEQLKRCPAGLDQNLGRSVAFGVAFHHAGLTMDERDIVEGAFRSSVVRVLVATSTVSSGVNLPSRRVIIRCGPRSGPAEILTYRQMVGRAGRMGKDTAGESFLICNGSERRLAEQLIKAALPPIHSSLGDGDLSSSLKRAVLEVIASGVVSTTDEVETYTNCTFLASNFKDDEELGDPLAACVEYLQANEFVRVSGSSLGATALAEACLSASLPPDQGLKLLKELHRARQCFVLETELHVIYQVTPYSVTDQWGQLDWLRVLSLWEDLPVSMKRVGELVGVEERFLVRAVRGTVNTNSHDLKLNIHRRFYTALALQDLVNEVPLAQVAVKFDCSKGMLQSLQQSASTFAGMVTQFSRRLGWANVELLVSQFAARLQFGAQRELLDLLRLDCLTAVQARALYNAGVQGLADLATASLTKVEKALARATPFQSEAEEEGSSAKCRIWLVGRCAATEVQAANTLVQEARQYLERELGLESANWGDLNGTSEQSSSESLITQPLDTPPKAIGPQPKEVADSRETNSNHQHSDKEELENKDSILEHYDHKLNAYALIDKNAVAQPKSLKNISHDKPLNSPKKINTNPAHENCQSKCDIKPTPVIGMETPKSMSSSTAENARKRGSLDLFDSPDRSETSINNESCGGNIEGKIILNSPAVETVNNQSTDVAVVNGMTLNLGENENIHVENKHLNSSPTSMLKPPAFSLLGLGSGPISSLQTTPNTQSPCNKSVFFDSPLPSELDQVQPNLSLKELDANFGGESLLEISSFVIGSESKIESFLEEVNLLDANVGGDSLLEISSFVAEREERKRKREEKETTVTKRLKITTRSSIDDNRMLMNPDDLQVSKVTSTNCNSQSIKTSTPTCSNYFDGSAGLNSLFLDYEDVNSCAENQNGGKCNTDNAKTKNFNCNYFEDFESGMSKKFSENGSLFRSEFDLHSEVCNKIDCKYKNYEGHNNQQDLPSTSLRRNKDGCDNSSNMLSESVNINTNQMSPCERICVVNNTSKRFEEKEETPSVKHCLGSDDNINETSFGESVNIDSKLINLMDENIIVADGKKVNIENRSSNTITSQFTLNSQICGLLDQVKLSEGNIELTDCTEKTSEQFENNDNDINTQSCNILDNNDSISEGVKYEVKKPLWTESMEIKEILDLTFDEDTVFGTPQTLQKSISFKKFGNNKLKDKFNSETSHKFAKEPVSDNHQLNLLNVKTKRVFTPHTTYVKKENNIIKKKTEKIDLSLGSEKQMMHNSNVTNQNIRRFKESSPISVKNVKDGKTPAEDKTVIVDSESTKEIPRKSTAVYNSLTNTFLEAAFDSSFNQVTKEQVDDEVGCSQRPPVTPHKTLRERAQNATDSPTVNKNAEVKIINVRSSDPQTLDELLKILSKQKSIALELVVSSVGDKDGGVIGANIVKRKIKNDFPCNYQGSTVTAIALCWGETAVYLLSLDDKSYVSSLKAMEELFCRSDLTVHMWEAKSTLRLLKQCCHLQSEVSCRLSDPAVAQWLLKPHVPLGTLKQLAQECGVSAPQCAESFGFRVVLIWRLSRLLKAKLKQISLYNAFTEIEMPTQLLLAEMEVLGVRWDREYADQLWTAVEKKMVELQNTLFSLSGKKFSLRSRNDLAKIKKTMNESSEAVQTEFNTTLHNWRVLNSLKTRNMSPLMMLEGDRVRGSWETHSVTGRISMQEPSLQHIPRDILVGDECFSLRSAFIAGPGNCLVSADFCQLELRLLAHLSQDTGLLHSFSQPGDVFMTIAAEWNHIPVDQVTENLRQHTKQLCYGLIYGMSVRTLADEMCLEEPSAAEMVESFHRTYPGIQCYISQCVSQCRVQGYVSTISGRRRFLPEITTSNKARRGQAERQAVNTTIQGSAADIAKTAMLRVHEGVRHTAIQAQLIIHLHDELIYEVSEEDTEEFVKVLRKEMEGAVSLSIPLPVKVKKGPSWGQLLITD